MGQALGSAKPASKRPVVLILGGGYGGVTLARLLDASEAVFVILVDAKEFFLHHVAAPRMCAEKHLIQQVMIPYASLLKNGVVVQGAVQSITPRAVTLHGRVHPLQFDFLVIALGSKYTFPFKLDTTPSLQPSTPPSSSEAAATPVAPLHFMLDSQAAFSSFHSQITAARKVAVVGGGCVGIETAAELASKYCALQPAAAPAAAASPNHTIISDPVLAAYDAKRIAAAAAAASYSAPAPVLAKEVLLLHSGVELMNRQQGLRDTMRKLTMQKLQQLGVHVRCNERVELESIRCVSSSAEPASQLPADSLATLQRQGFLAAPAGCTFSFDTIRRAAHAIGVDGSAAVPVDAAAFEPAVSYSGVDFILLATGVKFSPELYQASDALRSSLDDKGRLLVNEYFQLAGDISPQRRDASVARASAAHAASGTGPSPTSSLHGKTSFHFPALFAIGDCCVPLAEVGLRLNPQAYHAHKHAYCVAANILNMINRRALVPYEGSGPLSLFLSLGPTRGVTQLPNRQNAVVGDRMTVLLKSADMHVDNNWAFLNADRSRPSFKGGASAAFGAATPTSVSAPSPVAAAAAASVAAPSPLLDAVSLSSLESIESEAIASSPASPHPNDAPLMRSQAEAVEEKLSELAVTPPALVSVGVTALRRPIGTELLSVNLSAASSVPSSAMAATASPVSPILDPQQTREFEEAMRLEEDAIDA